MKKILFAVFALSVVLNAGLLFYIFNSPAQENFQKKQEIQSSYPFLSFRVINSDERDFLINFVPLHNKLNSIVSDQYGNNFTVYFEYLPTGNSIGINENIQFYPGSLLKVPAIMAYYHQLEESKDTQDKVVTLEENHIDNHFGTLWTKGVGYKIKLSDAVKLALTESDNTAVNVIRSQVERKHFADVYQGLDIDMKVVNEDEVYISTKAYSSILKALFFSSLLSVERSNYILELLSQSKFTDKLVAGVPKGVKVAHKIGVVEKTEIPIYSDCGIVYVPRRQYLLCMASKSDEVTARERMKKISKIVYEYVANAKLPD